VTERILGRPLEPPPSLSPADWERASESLKRFILELVARVGELEREVAELKERVGTNSSNSSKPPSTDGTSIAEARRKRRREDEKRQRGGQPGHPGKTRKLLPVAEVDAVVPVRTEFCSCGGTLCIDEEDPERHQVWELPAVRARVTEYQVFFGWCERCTTWTKGELPAEASVGMLGPRAMAVVATLTGKFRLSKRATEEVLRDLFGLDVCVGTISNVEAMVSETLVPAYEQACAAMAEQPVVNMDETGWREDKKRAWLWTAVTALVTVFVVRRSRGSQVAKELLGEAFRGVLGSDRWSAYTWVPLRQRQLCWAHLIRDFRKIAERGGDSGDLGEAMLDVSRHVFRLWDRFRRGDIDRLKLKRRMASPRVRLRALLDQGLQSDHAKTRGTCAEIRKLERALWTFTRVEGVEPTNNSAERAIRPGVIWRKTSFGTDSSRGSRFAERVLTVVATCRQQNRNVLEYLSATIHAKLSGHDVPSLLPAQHSHLAAAA